MPWNQVVVVGTGRSGTHWVGRTLGGHPDVSVDLEEPKVFGRITAAAIYPSRARIYVPWIAAEYRRRSRPSTRQLHVDKSHPALWIAEPLARRLPRLAFVGVVRNPYATVASSLRHKGVRRWLEQWERYPVPNRFLGIDHNNVDAYREMSLAARSALRWKVHREEVLRLRAAMPDRVRVVEYETLMDSIDAETRRLWSFLGLRPISPPEAPNPQSRNKWRTQLTSDEIEDVARVAGVSLPAA